MLDMPLKQALRTTERHLRRLRELGIETVGDFLSYFPRVHNDASDLRKLTELKGGEVNTTQLQIMQIFTKKARSGMYFTRAVCADETGTIEVLWFNQPHLKEMLFPKMWVTLHGKVKYEKMKLSMLSPRHELMKKEQIHMARIVPVYHETELNMEKKGSGRLNSGWMREKLHELLPYTEYFEDFLPEALIKKHKLMPYSEAVRNIHFPKNEETLARARSRLAFNELFLLQLAALRRKHLWRARAHEQKNAIKIDSELTKKFIANLPFELTRAQKRVLTEILIDLEKPYPMSRLMQGDVGSGKTIVAAIAILNVIRAGHQACIMAPTEILARQHYKTLMKALQPHGINIQFVAGSTTNSQKEAIIKQMKTGTVDLVVGTHSLIQEGVGFKKLGLAVIDEQHRFGVKQREILQSFGGPHLLNLSATPIPRTLALTVYGDQDLSIIDEMPVGRQEIVTRVVPEKKRADAYLWVEDQVAKGRQVFVICPLIEEQELAEDDMLQIRAATAEFDRLRETVFPNFKVGLLHGRMKTQDKDEIMQRFNEGDIDILVSTAVVEVGIDVPNATIIIIEGSERFGLAQLHQFRGRVGRGEHQSYCFLFPTTKSGNAITRLKAMVKHSSGFKLAEIDLELRGPGEIYGIRQAGIPDLKMASFGDSKLIELTRKAAEEIIAEDPYFEKHENLRLKLESL